MSKAKKPAAKKSAAKKAKAAKSVVFVVMRRGFEASSYRDELPQYLPVTGSHVDIEAEVPVRAFTNRAEALTYARLLDDEVRASFPPPLLTEAKDDDERENPFPLVAKRAGELGLPPIKLGKDEYTHPTRFREWWAEWAWDLSAEQKAALWEPFAGLTFHHVREIELEG